METLSVMFISRTVCITFVLDFFLINFLSLIAVVWS